MNYIYYNKITVGLILTMNLQSTHTKQRLLIYTYILRSIEVAQVVSSLGRRGGTAQKAQRNNRLLLKHLCFSVMYSTYKGN